VKQLEHGLKGKKYRHRGKEYHIFCPFGNPLSATLREERIETKGWQPLLSLVLEFLNNLWGLGTDQE
jgi:hypothetical protein